MQKYMNKKVKEMAVDDAVEGFFLLKNPVPKTTQSGKTFLSFKLADASGEIEGIFWDYDGTLHATNAGKPAKVRGTISDSGSERRGSNRHERACSCRPYRPETDLYSDGQPA